MLTLCCNIEIGKYRFKYTAEVSIQSSWKTLTDTASIKLPNYKAEKLDEVINIGDQVKIQLGYNDKLNTEFEGFVTEKLPNTPFEIKCEDMINLLKQTKIKDKTLENTTLKGVLEHSIESVKKRIGDEISLVTAGSSINTKIDSFIFENYTAASALQALKEKYNLAIYCLGKKLYAGQAYLRVDVLTRYHFQKNVVQTDLTYKEKASEKINVKAISIREDNTVVEAEVPDSNTGGEPHILRFYGIKDKTKLKAIANEYYSRLNYDGYAGNITTFGIPYIEHGYKVKLEDEEYPDRAGTYYIDEVNTSFGTQGFRRTVTLGKKV